MKMSLSAFGMPVEIDTDDLQRWDCYVEICKAGAERFGGGYDDPVGFFASTMAYYTAMESAKKVLDRLIVWTLEDLTRAELEGGAQ